MDIRDKNSRLTVSSLGLQFSATRLTQELARLEDGRADKKKSRLAERGLSSRDGIYSARRAVGLCLNGATRRFRSLSRL